MYDSETKRFLGSEFINTSLDMTSRTVDIECETAPEKEYIVKAMIWNEQNEPITKNYSVTEV